jgi:hypothetical protein
MRRSHARCGILRLTPQVLGVGNQDDRIETDIFVDGWPHEVGDMRGCRTPRSVFSIPPGGSALTGLRADQVERCSRRGCGGPGGRRCQAVGNVVYDVLRWGPHHDIRGPVMTLAVVDTSSAWLVTAGPTSWDHAGDLAAIGARSSGAACPRTPNAPPRRRRCLCSAHGALPPSRAPRPDSPEAR